MRDQFRRDGYLHFAGLVSPEEARRYRCELQSLSGKGDEDFRLRASGKGWTQADGVTRNAPFWDLIFHEGLLSRIRAVLGSEARYTQHSDLHVNHGSVGWHRDSADRRFGSGEDWDESDSEYEVVRVAIYFQSYEESGFRLGVVPGSHRKESALTSLELDLWNGVGRVTGRRGFIAPLMSVRPRWLQVGMGDCIIFSQRLLHSGSPIHGPKYSVYLSYGTDGRHSVNHVNYYRHRRPDLQYGEIPPLLQERLKARSLLLDCSRPG